ncbi:MAG TPA: alpha/beta fold hydrolase, partial [Wenzhouxiangella sp.]|nr:alpha/beta fold hydrolase [Wenzhouxiangella sp.]
VTDSQTETMNGSTGTGVLAILGLAALLASGCMFRDLERQISMIDDACLVTGSVAADDTESQAVMVAMLPGDAQQGQVPRPIDFTLAGQSGDFSFALAPGSYRFLAFEDRDGNLELDDDEPARHAYGGEVVECAAGEQLHQPRITLARDDRVEAGSLSVQGSRSLVAEAMESAVSLGQLTSFGEVVPLDDARFNLDVARSSMWRPVDFLRAGHSGVYLREPLDDRRTPVLFIHGINGSPRVLEPLIDHLDGERLQPLYFYYASGLRIDQVVWHLDRIMRELEHRHGIERFHVVAHSMGGLVARAWLRKRAGSGQRARIVSFISLSTPWLGYPSARQGVDHLPVVVPVWRDMASGSEFLTGLFDGQAAGRLPPFHLLFGYGESGWLGAESGDGVATLASMLPVPAQRQAASVFGVNAGHVGIVSDDAALERVEHLLLQAETAAAVKSSAGSLAGAR